MAFHPDRTEASGTPAVAQAVARWQEYLEALDCAGQAMDRARQLVPDHGLDHGVERIRALLITGVAALERLQAEAEAQPAAAPPDQAAAGTCPDQ